MSFRFKQFEIAQERTAMKVGTDGVLLGAWARVDDKEQHILDIGTGTALIAIMMAQRCAKAQIVGVEIDENSAQQACENASRSPWAERVRIEHTAIQEYNPTCKFDVILSNPPYFVDSLHAKDESRTRARHTTSLSFADLCSAVERLLSPSGRFTLILPPTETQLFDDISKGRLHLVRRCFVRGKEGGEIRRVMSEYTPSAPTDIELSELSIRATHADEYSPEYRALTADFYLKF